MKLAVIIVNWNSGESLHKCIGSLIESTFRHFECIIVDNGSTDKSIEYAQKAISDTRIKYINNNCNSGFGKACNQALSIIESEYVLFLNPDTIVPGNTLERAINFIEEHDECEVLGVKNIDLNHRVVATCSRFPSTHYLINDILGLSKLAPKIFKPGIIMSDWDHLDSRYVDHVIGAFYLVNFASLKKVGFFDERFFLYLEDLDLSKRIINNGGHIFYNSEIKIIHECGGTTKEIKALRLFYSLRSRIIFCEKYSYELNYILILILSIALEPLIRVIYSLFHLDFRGIIYTFKGYGLFIKWLLSTRKIISDGINYNSKTNDI